MTQRNKFRFCWCILLYKLDVIVKSVSTNDVINQNGHMHPKSKCSRPGVEALRTTDQQNKRQAIQEPTQGLWREKRSKTIIFSFWLQHKFSNTYIFIFVIWTIRFIISNMHIRSMNFITFFTIRNSIFWRWGSHTWST